MSAMAAPSWDEDEFVEGVCVAWVMVHMYNGYSGWLNSNGREAQVSRWSANGEVGVLPNQVLTVPLPLNWWVLCNG